MLINKKESKRRLKELEEEMASVTGILEEDAIMFSASLDEYEDST